MTSEKPDDMPDWVETLTGIAGSLGFNKVRVRWKLRGWVNRRRAAARRDEQTAIHVQYQHRVCSQCHAVNDRDEQACNRCGQPLGSRVVEKLGRLGFHAPRALSLGSLVGVIVVAAYVRIFAAHGGGLSLSIDALVAHGASLPLDQNGGESWRAVTSVLLHAGLFHLAFNLFALASIAPVAEDRFGRGVALLLFMVTGTVASFGSELLGPPAVGVGASGAIMGLVGAVAGAGHRAGTGAGRDERDAMIKWVIYVFIFGVLVGADHYAHGVGLVAGAAFGLGVPPRMLTRASARGIQIAAGAAGLAMLVAATVAVMVPLATVPTWAASEEVAMTEWPTGDPGDGDDLGTMVWLCRDGVTAEDVAAMGGKQRVAPICASLDELRRRCAVPNVDPGKWTASRCGDLKRLDGTWPPSRRQRE